MTVRFETKAYRAWVGFNVPAHVAEELDLHDGQLVDLVVKGSVTGEHPKRQEIRCVPLYNAKRYNIAPPSYSARRGLRRR